MIKTSKRMLSIGDPYCGKSSYIRLLAKQEKESGSPVLVSDDQNEFEFSIGNKSNERAFFLVTDTANQERYRSLTQNFYRKTQCALLIFNKNNEESFYNLNKWHSDIMSYSANKDNDLSIVLVCLKIKPSKTSSSKSRVSDFNSINLDLIEKFQKEKSCIVGYCEIDLNEAKNLKEPFEILFEHLKESKYVMTGSTLFLNESFYSKLDKFEQNSDENEQKCCNIN